jgi:copper transport protein
MTGGTLAPRRTTAKARIAGAGARRATMAGEVADLTPHVALPRLRRLLALVALVSLVLIAFASPAGAHSALEETSPAAGDSLDAPPSEIRLVFTQSVDVDDGDVQVFDATADAVDAGDLQHPQGDVVILPLEPLDAGGYVVTWRAISADGHPIAGGFTFRVGDAAAVDPELVEELLASQSSDATVGAVFGVVRGIVFGGLLLLVGAAAFIALFWPAGAAERRTRRLLWTGWWALFTGTLLGIGLQAADVAGLGIDAAFDPNVVADVLDTRFGEVWLARLVLLIPAAVLVDSLARGRVRSPWWRAFAAVTGIGLLLTPALSGHADTGRWVRAAQVADVVHVGSAALWLGGLAVLLFVALRTDAGEAVASRFSDVALGAVVVVVVTGMFQSVRQIDSLDALETSYGRLLAVKVVLVAALIGVASISRTAVRQGARSLRTLVAVEVAMAVVIVGVTAMLVDAVPSRYVQEASGGPFQQTKVVDDVLVDVVLVPGVAGPNDIHVYVTNPAGGLTSALEVTGTLSLPSQGIEGIEVPFVVAGRNHWSSNDLDIPIAGAWELTVTVLLTEIDQIEATFTIPIGGSS